MPKSPRRSSTAFAIVLFTDMVGSTAIASELGDRRWKVLQAKHHSLIRTQLREHGGREIDTAGDGFFAAFSEGEAAIRCACAIRDAVMGIGLQVRCGLNVGQVEMNDGKPTGAAVVAAARIMTKAGDGEVLVSNLLRELLPGIDDRVRRCGHARTQGLGRLVAPVPGHRGRRSAIGRSTTCRGVGGPSNVNRRLFGGGWVVW